MEDVASKLPPSMDSSNGSVKRKRSLSVEAPPAAPAPPAKISKPNSSHLQINYLVRQYADILPLISHEDAMPSILQTLSDYAGVLDRHESLAGNLGARPLGPILIKRFERIFDGAPRVLKSHGKEGTTVTWLDVVEFARHKPEQFNLEKMRDGVRVCQFYTKQSRVEISEEDFLLISSGMPQKLIPPQPIAEDEEKELGTLEILEKSISQVIQLADQVSARARRTKHGLTSRRNAIVNRRSAEAEASTSDRPSSSGKNEEGEDGSGFTAVNNSRKDMPNGTSSSGKPMYTGSTASPTTRAELVNLFTQQRERLAEGAAGAGAATDYSTPATTSRSQAKSSKGSKISGSDIDYVTNLLNSASPVPLPNTPSNPRAGGASERYDDSGPYKAEMLSRMDSMQRGDRVMPPCDRCRRLHMDCLKNLTACLGCTKKHAKCSWKEVTEEELRKYAGKIKDSEADDGDDAEGDGEDEVRPVRDEELLAEEDSDDDEVAPPVRPPEPEIDVESEGKRDSASVNGEVNVIKPISRDLDSTNPGASSGTDQAANGSPSDLATGGTSDLKSEDVQAAARQILKNRLEQSIGLAGDLSDDISSVTGGNSEGDTNRESTQRKSPGSVGDPGYGSVSKSAGLGAGPEEDKDTDRMLGVESTGEQEHTPSTAGVSFASVNGVGA